MAILALIAFVVSPGLMIVAIWMAYRAPRLRFRWLWYIAAVIAVSQWGFNTVTGASKFVALHGAIVGSVITPDSDQHVGWTFKSAIPLGAFVVIALLLRRRRTLKNKAAQDIPPT